MATTIAICCLNYRTIFVIVSLFVIVSSPAQPRDGKITPMVSTLTSRSTVIAANSSGFGEENARTGNNKKIKNNKTSYRSGTRKPYLLVGLANSTSSSAGTNDTKAHRHFIGSNASSGNSGIGYGGEYAEEWPIYVAILGLTIFAYVAWVLVYCLCQRHGNNGNNSYPSSITSTSTVGPGELAGQDFSQPRLMPRLSTITNGSLFRGSSLSMPFSVASGSPECSLEGASLHDMIPPKYFSALGATGNFSFNGESANNTLVNCNDDFMEDGNETYILLPRHVPSSSPPGYSDLTRISVVINAPVPSDDEMTGTDEVGNTNERSPLVVNEHRQPITTTTANNSNNRQFLQASPPGSWIRRSVARLHSNSSSVTSHTISAITKSPAD